MEPREFEQIKTEGGKYEDIDNMEFDFSGANNPEELFGLLEGMGGIHTDDKSYTPEELKEIVNDVLNFRAGPEKLPNVGGLRQKVNLWSVEGVEADHKNKDAENKPNMEELPKNLEVFGEAGETGQEKNGEAEEIIERLRKGEEPISPDEAKLLLNKTFVGREDFGLSDEELKSLDKISREGLVAKREALTSGKGNEKKDSPEKPEIDSFEIENPEGKEANIITEAKGEDKGGKKAEEEDDFDFGFGLPEEGVLDFLDKDEGEIEAEEARSIVDRFRKYKSITSDEAFSVISFLGATRDENLGLTEDEEAELMEMAMPAAKIEGGDGGEVIIPAEGGKAENDLSAVRKKSSKEKEQAEGKGEFKSWEDFGLSEPELENSIEGFKELSHGQRLLLLENFRQVTLGRIERESLQEQRKLLKGREKGDKFFSFKTAKIFANNLWEGLSKNFKVSEFTKIKIENIKENAMETHEPILQELVSGLKEFGPEVVEREDGELEFHYVNPEEFEEKDRGEVEEFNKASYEWSRIPHLWALKGASRSERERYREAKERYDKSREYILSIKSKNDKKAESYLNGVEEKIAINQYLNSNPDVEERLENIKDKKYWEIALRSTATERGLYFGMGLATRTATAGLLKLAGASLMATGWGMAAAAVGLGGAFAKRRAEKARVESAVLSEADSGSQEKGLQYGETMRAAVKLRREIAELNKNIFAFEKRRVMPKEAKDLLDKLMAKEKELKKLEKEEERRFLEMGNYMDAEYVIASFQELENNFKEMYAGGADSLQLQNIDKARKNEIYRDRIEEIVKSLKFHIDDAKKALKEGKINFGSGGRFVKNHYEFIRRLAEAESFVKSYDIFENEELKEKYADERKAIEETFFKKIKKGESRDIRNKVFLGAAIAGGYYAGGYLLGAGFDKTGGGGEAPRPVDGAEGVADEMKGGEPAGEFGQNQTSSEPAEAQEVPVKEPVFREPLNKETTRDPFNTEFRKEVYSPEGEKVIEKVAELPNKEEVQIEPLKKESITIKEKDILNNNFGSPEPIDNNLLVEKPGSVGLKNNFSLKLGEGKVPAQLERVFHMMSVDSMEDVIGADNMFGEEEGAKSLNVAANLVKLAEGKDVPGVDSGTFKDAVEWNPKTGELKVKDYETFNEIVRSLHGHADELWEKGSLQKGAAAYLDDIKKDTWEDIVKAEGLDKAGEIETGIEGHDNIGANKITDFENSQIVAEAEKMMPAEAPVAGEQVAEKIPDEPERIDASNIVQKFSELDLSGDDDVKEFLEDTGFMEMSAKEQENMLDNLKEKAGDLAREAENDADNIMEYRQTRELITFLQDKHEMEYGEKIALFNRIYDSIQKESAEIEKLAARNVEKRISEIYSYKFLFFRGNQMGEWQELKDSPAIDIKNGDFGESIGHTMDAAEQNSRLELQGYVDDAVREMKSAHKADADPISKETVSDFLTRYEEWKIMKNDAHFTDDVNKVHNLGKELGYIDSGESDVEIEEIPR